MASPPCYSAPVLSGRHFASPFPALDPRWRSLSLVQSDTCGLLPTRPTPCHHSDLLTCLLHEQRWEAGHQCFRWKPARTGPCFKALDARATFLIFRRNLVRRLRAIAPCVRFVGKPGRRFELSRRGLSATPLIYWAELMERSHGLGALTLSSGTKLPSYNS